MVNLRVKVNYRLNVALTRSSRSFALTCSFSEDEISDMRKHEHTGRPLCVS
jgi:hypothetical protein